MNFNEKVVNNSNLTRLYQLPRYVLFISVIFMQIGPVVWVE